VTVHAAAAGEKAGSAWLILSPSHGEHGWHRIAQDNEEGDLALEVPVVRLDDVLDGEATIDVLKIDAEGHEPFVLAGAQRMLEARRITCIVVELNDEHLRRAGSSREALIAQIHGYGYSEMPPPSSLVARLRSMRRRQHQDTAVFVM
jgi:hypothetical protein